MTDQDIRQIDEQISAFGWTYNPLSEQFEAIPRGGAAPSPVAWEDIIVAVPNLSLNALMEYESASNGSGGERRGRRSPLDRGCGAGWGGWVPGRAA